MWQLFNTRPTDNECGSVILCMPILVSHSQIWFMAYFGCGHCCLFTDHFKVCIFFSRFSKNAHILIIRMLCRRTFIPKQVSPAGRLLSVVATATCHISPLFEVTSVVHCLVMIELTNWLLVAELFALTVDSQIFLSWQISCFLSVCASILVFFFLFFLLSKSLSLRFGSLLRGWQCGMCLITQLSFVRVLDLLAQRLHGNSILEL